MDEGISGCNTKHRNGFNEMIVDALAGKISLIVTKSVSRFARNTVDSLVTIRKLKEHGCECFFEKENIFTFDSKGELLITIMSSLAQEESRSISENVTWGARKRFADGKYTMHYSEFLGYRKGADGAPEIDEREASVIRRIFYMCIEGYSYYEIAKALTDDNIKTPMDKRVWGYSVVKSILNNEKYIGDALLQKTVSVSFLTKKRVKNNGAVQQYYVKDGHPAIISKEIFAEARAAQEKAKEKKRKQEGRKPFSKRLRCGLCGRWYVESVRNPNTPYEKRLWRCGNNTKNGTCLAPFFTAAQVGDLISGAEKELREDKDLFLSLLPRLYTSSRVLEVCRMEREEIENAGSTPDASPRLGALLSFIRGKEELNEAVEQALETGDISSLPADIPGMLIEYIEIYSSDNITARYVAEDL